MLKTSTAWFGLKTTTEALHSSQEVSIPKIFIQLLSQLLSFHYLAFFFAFLASGDLGYFSTISW